MAWYTEYREKTFELYKQGYEAVDIALNLGLTVEEAEQVLKKVIPKPVPQRNRDMYEKYKSGKTLEAIGKEYGITRERVRQLIQLQVATELGIPKWRLKEFREQINDAMSSFVSNVRDSRQEKYLNRKLSEAATKGIKPEYFTSLSAFCKAADIPERLLEAHRPDIYKSLKFVKGKRWSLNYPACRNCGTTLVKHRGMGLCENCYYKSDYFKDIVKRSYQRNKEARSIQNKKFRDEYFSRPEVIAREEKKYDEQYFGGNRKVVLERDNYRCINCGMSVEVKNRVGRPKVRVWHVNGDANDNSLSNLKTYCQSCYLRIYGSFGNRKTL